MDKTNSLLERLEAVKLAREMEQAIPVDALSQSLYEFGAELAALDDDGAIALADELGITPDDVREMARSYAR